MVWLAIGLFNETLILGDKLISKTRRPCLTKEILDYLGVYTYICFGDRIWYNHRASCFYCITPERFQLLSQL